MGPFREVYKAVLRYNRVSERRVRIMNSEDNWCIHTWES